MSETMVVSGEWVETALERDAGVVQILRVELGMPETALAAMRSKLAQEEAARAAGFKFDVDRNRYVAARGALRHILGGCIGVAPADVCLRVGEHGKPALSEEHNRADLHFNLAHSGGRALVAIASEREVGVDLERVREDIDHQEIAERFFGSERAEALRESPEAERAERFALVWTRMEACAKASGLGLGLARTQLDEHDWEIMTVRPWDGYVAAVASRGREWSARLWDWSLG